MGGSVNFQRSREFSVFKGWKVFSKRENKKAKVKIKLERNVQNSKMRTARDTSNFYPFAKGLEPQSPTKIPSRDTHSEEFGK